MTEQLSVLVGGLDHPEGVAWDPRGYLIAGGEAGQVWRIDVESPASPELVAETGGFCLGMAVDGAGNIYVCDMDRAAVLVVDPTTGSVETYSAGTPDAPMRVPNFPAFGPDGTLYVSDSGAFGENNGHVYAITPDGATRVASDAAAAFPNGLALSPTGEHLVVVETSLPGISRIDVRADGSLGERRVEIALPGTVPDGIAFADSGHLLISCYRPDVIYSWDGVSLEVVAEDRTGLTLSAPTNVAFFGEDLARLCSANLQGHHLIEISTDLRGHPLNYPDL